MAKNLIILALVAVIAVLGWYFLYKDKPETPSTETPSAEEEQMVICAQVITPARNPSTGEIKEFPTPCDVPDGWETIENDIPTLDLEVQ